MVFGNNREIKQLNHIFSSTFIQLEKQLVKEINNRKRHTTVYQGSCIQTGNKAFIEKA